MIASYRDKQTRTFAEGKRVKAFTGFERKAELHLDQLDTATSLLDLDLPGNPAGSLEGRPQGSVQHSHQRPMAAVLCLAKGSARSD